MADEFKHRVKEPLASSQKVTVEHHLRDLSSEFIVAQEWGLFNEEKESQFIACFTKIDAALNAGDLVTANIALIQGRALLAKAQISGSLWYTLNNRFGFLPILFTAISSFLVFKIVFQVIFKLSITECLHNPAFLGLAGSILKSLYWLQFQTNKGLVRPRWSTSFIIGPFVGVLLGAISSLIVNVGFKLAAGSTQAAPDWQTVGLVAAFAGFNWEWALAKFQLGAEAVASRAFNAKRGEKKPS